MICVRRGQFLGRACRAFDSVRHGRPLGLVKPTAGVRVRDRVAPIRLESCNRRLRPILAAFFPVGATVVFDEDHEAFIVDLV